MWLRISGWTAGCLVLLLIGAASFAYFTYRHYDGRIHRADVLATSDPSIVEKTRQEHAQNFLLIGSDTRSGSNSKYETSTGEVAGARSDTTILAHLSPNGGKATLVSFPRDSYVHIPACRKAGGTTTEPHMGLFNSAFTTGGPACTIRLVQSITGIEIKHFVQIDFTGFKTMVSALGGVPVCSPQNVFDKDSGLRLHAGTQTITGEQALAYVRARYALGDGSDLDRIKRQQQFLGSMIRVATSKGILFSPSKLKGFLDAATRSVTLDEATHLGDLYGLSGQLRHLDAAHATFVTAPVANRDYAPPGYPPNAGKVLLDAATGKVLWKSIIEDDRVVPSTSSTPPPGRSRAPSSASPAPRPTLRVAAQDVTVKIINGTDERGLATRASDDLSRAGFAISTLSVQPSGTTAPEVRYPSAEAAPARTLAAAIPGSVLVLDPEVPSSHVLLVVGSSYSGAHTVRVDPSTPGSAGTSTPGTSAIPTLSGADASCSS